MIRKLMSLFKKKEPEPEITYYEHQEQIPAFSIGEPVIIVNPYMAEDEPPTHGTVTKIVFAEDQQLFLYQIDFGNEWVNENWLQYDIFGPKTFMIQRKDAKLEKAKDEKGRKLEIDYWLRSYSYEKAKDNEEGVQQAVNEINKLRGVK